MYEQTTDQIIRMKAATKSGAAPLTPQQLAAQETQQKYGKPERGWREQVYTVIFEAETRTGRAFDLVLIGAILLSVTVVVLSSVASVAARYGAWLTALEWFFTILFTVEYFARLSCLQHRCATPRVSSASSTCWPSCRPTSACCCRARTC